MLDIPEILDNPPMNTPFPGQAMNIWYFCMDPRPTSSDTTSAPAIHIAETIRALREQGHQVQPFLYGDAIRQSEQRLRTIARHTSRKNQLFQAAKPLLRDIYELYQNRQDVGLIEPIFRNNSIDFVYERLSQNRSSVSVCCRKYQIPLIVESNAPVDERREYWGAPLFPITRYLEKKILQRADAITVVSTPLKRYYQQWGLAEEKIFVLPNGVNPRRFSPRNVSQDVRRALGIENRVVIGFVGNIFAYHGIELFLPLARACRSQGNKAHFLIVGSGQGRDALQAALAQEGVLNYFSFVGPVPNTEVPDYLNAMDICILPRFMWYGSPMKIFEYGAMGKAIVAPNQENIRDVLTHGETAYLFEKENLDALVQAVLELVDNVPLRRQLGHAVQKHILQNHTWDENAKRILNIYRQVTQN
ncbi:MAG: glycosyltransferase family 1 protein [Caldilineae bacterium]|nr:MAG: glycosyltransferase family 1 protein [Caldilineae bacterium]